MEKRKQLRKELNLTQYEMSVVLRTTRSQLALYEKGLRELPTTALIRLSQIGLFTATSESSEAKQSSRMIKPNEETEKFFINALKDCKYYQTDCKRKIEKMERNYTATLKLLQLIAFLEKPTNDADVLHPGALLILKNKAKKSLEKNNPQKLIKLQFQLVLLQQQELVLTDVINNNTIEIQA